MEKDQMNAAETTPRAAEAASMGAAFDASEMLGNVAGSRHIATVMLKRLVSHMPLRMRELENALASSDAQCARREAHTIKSLAAYGGAAPLRQCALRLEQLCQQGLLAQAADGLPELQVQIERTIPEWQAFLDQG